MNNLEKYTEKNAKIVILSSEQSILLNFFKSNNSELNQFLAKDALGYQNLNLGITYLLVNIENKLVSYITLGMGALKIPDKSTFEFHGKKLNEYPKEFPNQFPALLIGKIATDKTEEAKGGATFLLKFATSIALELKQKIGCAYLVAHSYPESVNWYKSKGFKTYLAKTSERETIPVYFEL